MAPSTESYSVSLPSGSYQYRLVGVLSDGQESNLVEGPFQVGPGERDNYLKVVSKAKGQ